MLALIPATKKRFYYIMSLQYCIMDDIQHVQLQPEDVTIDLHNSSASLQRHTGLEEKHRLIISVYAQILQQGHLKKLFVEIRAMNNNLMSVASD